jgi:hypothetical protein
MASPTVEQGRASSATPSKLIGLVRVNALHSDRKPICFLSKPTGRSATPKSASAQTPPAKLDDDTIEDVIQRATASAGAGPPPGKDTRTQLFVGNVRNPSNWKYSYALNCLLSSSYPIVCDGKTSKIFSGRRELCFGRM